MLLKQKSTGHFLEVVDVVELTNLCTPTVRARLCYGEELGDPEAFDKVTLCFPSGEDLPRCWWDPHYRDKELEAHRLSAGSVV